MVAGCVSNLKLALSKIKKNPLTSFVVFVVLRVSLHAVVQLHQDGLQSRVHLLDQLMVHDQGPEQDAQHYTHTSVRIVKPLHLH